MRLFVRDYSNIEAYNQCKDLVLFQSSWSQKPRITVFPFPMLHSPEPVWRLGRQSGPVMFLNVFQGLPEVLSSADHCDRHTSPRDLRLAYCGRGRQHYLPYQPPNTGHVSHVRHPSGLKTMIPEMFCQSLNLIIMAQLSWRTP